MKITAYVCSLIFFSQIAIASEPISLNLDVKNKMDVKVTGVYQAQKDSIFCRKVTTADGEIRTVKKVKEVVVGESSAAGKYLVEVNQELGDSCDYQLVGLALSLSNKSLAFQASLSITPQENDPVGTQKILVGPKTYGTDTFYTTNVNDVKIGPSEKASISIEVVK